MLRELDNLGLQSIIPKIRVKLRIRTRIKAFVKTLQLSINLLSWLYCKPCFTSNARHSSQKRILTIWDFRSQPYSIGDLLILQEVALILCHQHNVNLVDVCILAERFQPARPSFVSLNVNSHNYKELIISLFPVILTGQHIGAIYFFDSHCYLEKYVVDNIHRYCVWPTGYLYATMEDLNLLSLTFICEFYKKYNFIPYLSFRTELVNWAKLFIKQHISPMIPIVIQLRNAKGYNPSRNSNIDAWLEFFQYCENRFPVTFIIICAKSEVEEQLRSLSNILIAKDFDTTIDQDLALIYCAAAYMGMSSGPSTVAVFTSKPYSIFKAHLDSYPNDLRVKHQWGENFVFSNEHQRWISGIETSPILIDEFSRLLSIIDVPFWQTFDFIEKQPEEVKLGLR